jgi:hypothetical protein
MKGTRQTRQTRHHEALRFPLLSLRCPISPRACAYFKISSAIDPEGEPGVLRQLAALHCLLSIAIRPV